MKYKGFFVRITPNQNLSREDKNGKIVACEGFTIEVFSDKSEEIEILSLIHISEPTRR